MNVDVVILSWTKDQNVKKMTSECIRSLHASETDHKFNVYVVETSHDPVSYDGATTIRGTHGDDKFNYNRSINIGLGACFSDGDYVVIANNDLVFHKGWFTEIVKADLDSASPYSPGWAPHKGLAGKITNGWKAGKEFTGWCVVTKRKVLNAIRPFDEQFDFWCADCDHSIQLSSRGYTHALVGTSIVTHLVSKSHDLLEKDDRNCRTIGSFPAFRAKYPNFNEATCMLDVVAKEGK